MIDEQETAEAVDLFLESEYYRYRARERCAIRRMQQRMATQVQPEPEPLPDSNTVTWKDIAIVLMAAACLMLAGGWIS